MKYKPRNVTSIGGCPPYLFGLKDHCPARSVTASVLQICKFTEAGGNHFAELLRQNFSEACLNKMHVREDIYNHLLDTAKQVQGKQRIKSRIRFVGCQNIFLDIASLQSQQTPVLKLTNPYDSGTITTITRYSKRYRHSC